MKRILAVVLLFTLLFSVALAAPETIDLETMTLAELEALDERVKKQIDTVRLAETVIGEDYIQLREIAAKIVNVEFRKNGSGDPYIVVTFDWTNTSDKAQYFSLAALVTAKQGGIGLDKGILWDVDQYNYTSVDPGINFTSKEVFKLRDDHSPVTIGIRSFLADNAETQYFTFQP